MRTLRASTLFAWVIMIMIMLTFDRFLEVYLNIRYNVYWTIKKTRISLVISFILTIIITIILQAIAGFDIWIHNYLITTYYVPSINALFFLVSAFTYGYIIKKISYNRQISNVIVPKDTRSDGKRPKLISATRNFLTPTLLVVTFFILMLVPFTVWGAHNLAGVKIHPITHDYIYISFMLSYTSDALIYILASNV